MSIEKIASLISKPPNERGTLEIELLIPFLKRHCEIFRDLNRGVVHDIIKNGFYQKAVRDDIIVQQGEKGLYMYVMLSGRASLYIDNFTEDVLPQPVASPTVTDFSESQQLRSLDRSAFGKFIIFFEAGKSFGEMALLSETSVRNATIVADELVDLLVIDKDLFNRTLRRNEELEFQVRKDFINKNPLFGRWSPQLKRLVEMSLKKETYSYNNTVVKQGDPVRGVFFISRGQVNLQVNTSLHNRQYPNICGNITSETAKRKSTGRDGSTLGLIQDHIRLRRKEGYLASEQRYMARTQHVCILQDNEILSDIEVILGLDTYLYSAVTTSYTEVYVLEMKNFDRLMSRKKHRATDKLKHIVFNKIKRRLDSEKIPIMVYLEAKIKTIMPKRGNLFLLEDVSTKVKQESKTEIVERKRSLRRPMSVASDSPRHWEMIRLNTRLRKNFISPSTLRREAGPRSRRELANIEQIKHSRREGVNRPNTAPAGSRARIRKNGLDQTSLIQERQTTPRISGSVARQSPRTKPSELYPQFFTTVLDFFQIRKINIGPKPITSQTSCVNDAENNEKAIEHLEARMESFYQKLDEQGRVHVLQPSYRLKRYQLKDSERMPSPGGRVLVRTKPCQIPSGAGHKHVRRFVVTRPSDLILAVQGELCPS